MMATMQDFSGLLFGGGGSGLEDYLSAGQQESIRNQAMLQAAAALLQAGGPSRKQVLRAISKHSKVLCRVCSVDRSYKKAH
jgi:hypothetical protein